MTSESSPPKKRKIKINRVTNRFLPLTETVYNGMEPELTIKDFTLLKLIGEGSFGKVYLVKHNKTGSYYAIKQISKLNKNNQQGQTYFRREIEIMYKIHQNNVVRLYNHFEDNEYCYFVMEYVQNGNLFEQASWKNNKCYSSYDVAKIIKELICAIYYLHNMNPPIIHRDIKPENILIDKNGFVKLTDFGWSNYVNSNEIRSTYCGTPLYLAPEMIKEIGHDEHLDIWCIGVLIFELLTGEVPFKGEDLKSLNNNILNLKISWTKDINSVAKNLISKILKPDPKDRISLVEMLQHPFFKEKLNDDNLERFLLKPDSIKYPLFLINEYTVEYYDNVILEKFCKENNIPNIFKHNIQEDKLLINEQLPEEISEIDKNLILNNSNNIGDINNNINEPYSNLLKDYKKLNNDYNELLIAKKEQEEKLNEYISKFNLLQQEKENLIKECENTLSEKLKLKTQLEEAKQQLKLNAYLIENMKENKNNIEEQYSNKIIDEKNEEIKNLNEKIKILENEQKKFDEKENIKLKNEFNKEKENYELIIKVKDEEIQNLIKAKDNIKIQEGKKYESIIAKYEEITKEKDKEIEMLKLKNKKLNMINKFMKSKEDNNSKNI